MRNSIVLGMFLLLLSAHSFAAETLLWSCSRGSDPKAVTVSLDSYPSESPYIVRIRDADILKALGLKGLEFESHAKTLMKEGEVVGYEALAGLYASGVDFTQENGGIKLIAVSSTREGIKRYPNSNWWFGPGECLAY